MPGPTGRRKAYTVIKDDLYGTTNYVICFLDTEKVISFFSAQVANEICDELNNAFRKGAGLLREIMDPDNEKPYEKVELPALYKDEKRSAQFVILVGAEEHKQFRLKALREGVTLNEYVRNLVWKDIEEQYRPVSKSQVKRSAKK